MNASDGTIKRYQKTISALEQIVLHGAAKCGQDFFDSITYELAAAMGADYTFIGKLAGENNNSVRTLSLCVDGKIAENFVYNLNGTPCKNVIGFNICSYLSGVADQFPHDHLLKKMEVEAYIGVPLFDSQNRSLGIVVALFREAVQDTGLAEMILLLFASRIANEIERQSMHQELVSSEARYQSVVDDMLDYISQFHSDGTLLFVNNSLADLAHMEREQMIGLSFYDFVDEKTQKIIKENLARLTPENSLYTHEQKTTLPDGSVIWIQWANRGIFDSKGKLLYFQGVGRDITERLTHEKEKEKLRERLHHSEKMLAVGQLAGGVAHDFNNQLAGIVGYADLLREELADDKDLVRYTENILIATKRSADLTAQLLAFARKGKFLSVNVDVHKIIGEVVGLLEHSIDKRISVKQMLAAQRPVVLGDPSQLQNAIMNLVLNARDAMPDGGELTITTDQVELDEEYCAEHPYEIKVGSYIQLCIVDTGKGIPREIQDRIFEPFFTTKEPGKGTGMGLAAVYGTVKNHAGSINVLSEAGTGTSIKVYLPHSKGEMYQPAVTVGSDGKLAYTAKVLLVDDEEMVLDVATKLLQKLGCIVTQSVNGADAVDYYKDHWQDIDLVIIDMVMPKMSGKDAYLNMKAVNPDIVAILSSGYSLDGDAQEIMDEGVNGFIQKPYRVSELKDMIAEVFEM